MVFQEGTFRSGNDEYRMALLEDTLQSRVRRNANKPGKKDKLWKKAKELAKVSKKSHKVYGIFKTEKSQATPTDYKIAGESHVIMSFFDIETTFRDWLNLTNVWVFCVKSLFCNLCLGKLYRKIKYMPFFLSFTAIVLIVQINSLSPLQLIFTVK